MRFYRGIRFRRSRPWSFSWHAPSRPICFGLGLLFGYILGVLVGAAFGG